MLSGRALAGCAGVAFSLPLAWLARFAGVMIHQCGQHIKTGRLWGCWRVVFGLVVARRFKAILRACLVAG